MKNVTLIFKGVTDNPNYQVMVNIYDGNKLICSSRTVCGKVTFCLATNRAYNIQARLLGYNLNTSFYVGNNTCDIYFSFCCCNNRRIIIFTLRDYNYNLPIESGELILWQSP